MHYKEEREQELHDIISDLLQNNPPTPNPLRQLFDWLLWAQKKQPQSLLELHQGHILKQIIGHGGDEELKGVTLLLGNANQDSLVIKYWLKEGLCQTVLKNYLAGLEGSNEEQEEQLHMLGSFVRAYHRHLNEETLAYYISQKECLLVQVCCGFYNCPEQITYTSTLSTLMSILKLPFANEIIQIEENTLTIWAHSMSYALRNSLKDTDQHLLVAAQADRQYHLHSLNDRIILWEDLAAIPHMVKILAPAFSQEVLLPLLAGSLNHKSIPLFTLKFALFMIGKFTTVLLRLKLLPQLGNLLFGTARLHFSEEQLSTACLPSFSLRNVHKAFEWSNLNNRCLNPSPIDEEQSEVGSMFLNVLRSKDPTFLECGCCLLVRVISAVKQCPLSTKHFIERLGFGTDGAAVRAISSTLMNQLTISHSLRTTRIILSVLLYIQPSPHLQESPKHLFIHTYRSALTETLTMLQQHPKLHPLIAQCFSYDVRRTQDIELQPEAWEDSELLFNDPSVLVENEELPFEQQLPETPGSTVRHLLAKCLLLRKAACRLIEDYYEPALPNYLHEVQAEEEPTLTLRPGDWINLPIKYGHYRCKLVDGKFQIPNCLLLEHSSHLILAYQQSKRLKIILNLKIKHLILNASRKKDRTQVQIVIRRYDPGMQWPIQTNIITLKYLQLPTDHLPRIQGAWIQRQIQRILSIISCGLKNIPDVSLL